jgi:ubiquinone biosynthesis protein
MAFYKHTRHLIKIGYSLARHDALFLAEEARIAPLFIRFCKLFRRKNTDNLRNGQRLAAALQDMGPTFIKLGQVLATRSDLIGEEVAADMASLQDRLPPFPFSEAKAIIEAELERPLDQLFTDFNETPVAAASVAQVHQATTPDGRLVAVKVIRPTVKQAFAHDLELFRWLAATLHRRYPQTHRLKLPQVVEMLAQTIALEMDLRMEAAAADEMATHFVNDPDYYIPKIDWQRTAEKVLTLEWLNGIRIDNVTALRMAGHNPDAVLAKSARALFRQVFQQGFFHADLHPGNMMVLEDGRVAVIDFGITGRLDKKTRLYLAEMLQGFLTGDYRKVAEIHIAAGLVPATESVDVFALACRSIGQPILNLPWHEMSVGRLLGQLFGIAEQFKMTVQPQLLLLQKTIVTAEGVGRSLNPTVNMWDLTRPLITDWAKEHYGVRARARETRDLLSDTLHKIPPLLNALEHLATPKDPPVAVIPVKGFGYKTAVLMAVVGGAVGWLVRGVDF